MAVKLRALYGCTQQQLYTASGMAWASYGLDVADFTAFKGKYTADYGTAALAALLAAKLIPTHEARNSVPETFRVQLLPLANSCLGLVRRLKSYIEDSYPGDLAKPQLNAAGFANYTKASNEGWEELNVMVTSCNLFITNNTTALEAGGTNMPAAFPATFATSVTAYETKYNQFITSSQATSGGTNTKVSANNAVYETTIGMMEDGRLMYEDNTVKRDLYTFSNIVAKLGGAGETGLRIKISDGHTGLSVPDYEASIQPGDEMGVGDVNGVLEVKMPEDSYTIVIIAEGYPPYTKSGVEITTGKMHRLDIVLFKL